MVGMVTQDELKELLEYEQGSGLFKWRTGRINNTHAGAVAGSVGGGYIVISIKSRLYKAHRLAFLYVTGAWPDECVDHIDGDRQNNRWANLRPATVAQNSQNISATTKNSSGLRGVTWSKHKKSWQAMIALSGKQTHLGYFKDPLIAHAAYTSAKSSLHQFNPVIHRQ